jgi:hypothetical protein
MQVVRGNLRKIVLTMMMCASGVLSGCGSSCFAGFSVNGNGGVIVKAGEPPPVCTLNQVQGMVRAGVMPTAACESCAPAIRVDHIFVALRDVEIHREGDNSDQWIDITPELDVSPRTVDLVGSSLLELAGTPAVVPAGPYDGVRVHILNGAKPREAEGSREERCGPGVSHCLLMGDGRVELLDFQGDGPEVLVNLSAESKTLLVFPESTSELQIRLGAQPLARPFVSDSGKPRFQIEGEVSLVREVRPD